jgi:hypothetical protein
LDPSGIIEEWMVTAPPGNRMLAVATALNWIQATVGGVALTEKEQNRDPYAVGNAVLGFFGAPLSVPYTLTQSSDSSLMIEQWLNWSLNMLASIFALLDAAKVLKNNEYDKLFAWLSALCGCLMITWITYDIA